jgi:hypothetical protein
MHHQYHNQTNYNWGTHTGIPKILSVVHNNNQTQKLMESRKTASAAVSLLINLQFSQFTVTFSKLVSC